MTDAKINEAPSITGVLLIHGLGSTQCDLGALLKALQRLSNLGQTPICRVTARDMKTCRRASCNGARSGLIFWRAPGSKERRPPPRAMLPTHVGPHQRIGFAEGG